MSKTAEGAKPRVKRIKRGKGHSYTIDGEPVKGVTTIIGAGVPKPALVGWAANTTAAYAVDHWAELAELPPSKRGDTLKQARYADRDEAANRGNEVHAIAHRLSTGAEVEVPEPLLGMVDSYLGFVESFGIVEIAVEATCVSYTHRYAGTLDLLATVDNGPELWILDWKTGRSGIFPEVALQLAAYANAEALLLDGVERPMPKIERAAAVWLRSDGFDVYPIEIGPDVFRTFLYAAEIARFTDSDRSDFVGDALPARPRPGGAA